MDLEERIARLEAVEEIRRLKARYFRCVDLREWDEFADLFTEDFLAEFGESTSGARSRAAFLAAVARHFVAGLSVHHGHEPEIDVLDADNATGLWPMFDLVESPADSGYVNHTGWGHYTERYRRCTDGRWRISRSRLSRIKRVELPKDPG
ncbi:MAG TPA: nuclear transport factor 2 family protein [Sporichthyaceae bacterium]|jgi:ketosteroid isomerase-like protein|nr:nuclear transport factor 2 family protein [Sporichthyaceae bacterium]